MRQVMEQTIHHLNVIGDYWRLQASMQ